MAQICVLEASVQLKSCPQKFFNFLKSQSQHIPNKAQSENVHGVEIHKGDWKTPGSVKIWKYSIEGKEETFNERIEVDEVNKTITYVAVGGNVLELYKNYKAIVNVENGNLKLRIEYEKLNDNTPPPKKYQQFIVNIVRDLDGNLVKG
ncbi:putative START-like domain-containing protein [Medicago truncatula]|uniref:Pathogenesis-related protein bet V I family protein n=1 Tax=Medicago truncatula TaxID=3880 RepID=G7I986_MEDTR|nr:MLP-like protein 328 [Medicago truncatula]AES59906.1 pathogenesis-related protein bet V I family protein [Medicago truncatula]RHN78001.1 putative START-like domain-containing protein [Medicago truncatula]